ncbi:Uu.00g090390.m01.CDS01 [Anthostomella pinea]|uniref:Uu.00g090390.m01.CDS01 n=1 Tax=Anthostomella pinea TaxID=933095 RepID=A0AAI8VHG1_9PEZI|nr:Uu.00g090390.m01.CDS01 [Anthostomella pinea]
MRVFSYWVFPIISGVVWLATLLGLLLHWIIDTHRKIYGSEDGGQTIAYISDVGAAELKPLFVAGCIITTIFLDLAFACDRLLRHNGRLVPNTSVGEKVLSGLSIVFAIIGTFGLCLLSGFDTAHYPTLHDIFLLLFIAGYLISAVFICWEYQRLGKKYRQHRVLRMSFWVKLTFIIVELGLAIGFAVCNFRKDYNHAAILEWVVAFVFTFYVFSFIIDLYPAVKTRNGDRYSLRPMNTNDMGEALREEHPSVFGQPRDTRDSDRTLTNAHNAPAPAHHNKGRSAHTDF